MRVKLVISGKQTQDLFILSFAGFFFFLKNEIHDKDDIYIYIYIYIRSRPGHVPGYPVMLDNRICNIFIQFFCFSLKQAVLAFI
jgi:hypothetical protein